MKKFKLFILSCLLICRLSATAQNIPFIKGKQEISFSWGYYSHEQVLINLKEPYNTNFVDYRNGSISMASNSMFPTPNTIFLEGRKRTGMYFVNYLFSPISKISVGIGAGIEQESATLRSLTSSSSAPAGSYIRRIYTISPEIRASYARNALINIYGLLGMGRCFVMENIRNDASGAEERSTSGYWMFQVSPIGIKVGRKVSGFAELGYGYKGVARGGVSFKF